MGQPGLDKYDGITSNQGRGGRCSSPPLFTLGPRSCCSVGECRWSTVTLTCMGRSKRRLTWLAQGHHQ